MKNHSDKKLLRIGILSNSQSQPQWVSKAINDIKLSSIANIELIIIDSNENEENLKSKKYCLYNVYKKIDNYLFKTKPDAFKKSNIINNLDKPPIVNISTKNEDTFYLDKDVTNIQKYDLDVILNFSNKIIKGNILKAAKYGIWSYFFGNKNLMHIYPHGFFAVMNENPLTLSGLIISKEGTSEDIVILQSYSSTYKHSVKINNNRVCWKSSGFVITKLNELSEKREHFYEKYQLAKQTAQDCNQPYETPSNYKMLILIFGFCKRLLFRKLQKLFYNDQWILAYNFGTSNNPKEHLSELKNIIPPKDRLWADPFPVKYETNYFIFIEELLFKENKGVISVVKMDNNGNYKPPVKILEKEYHLSYPFIFEYNNKFYMIPETSNNRTIELYSCSNFPYKWNFEKLIFSDIRAVDTTLFKIEDVWWMFANISINGASNDEELHIFYSKNPLSQWIPHKKNPVKSDVRSSRPGGRLFFYNDDLYRPSQNCSKASLSITISKIEQINEEDFIEAKVAEISPKSYKNMLRVHTLNNCDELTIVDGIMRRRKI